MPSLDDYLALITSEYRYKPKFLAWAAVLLQGLVDAQNVAAALPTLFDVDIAIGDQLDKVGEWVGIAREITVVEPTWFSWGTPGLGWGQGRWQGQFDSPDTLTIVLDDYHYRVLIKARVVANNWDGTIEGAYAAWNTLFSADGFQVLIQNVGPKAATFAQWLSWGVPNLGWGEASWHYPSEMATGLYASDDMHIILALVGPPLDAITKAMFTGGYLDLKPAGVQVDSYVTQGVPGRPLFSWSAGPTIVGDYTAPPVNLAGWDMGYWGDFSVRPPVETTTATISVDSGSPLENERLTQRDATAAIEIAQNIGHLDFSSTAFNAGVPGGFVAIITVVMQPFSPTFHGSLAITGTNSGGFVLLNGTLTQPVSGTPPGTYSLTVTATQTGYLPYSQTESLIGT